MDPESRQPPEGGVDAPRVPEVDLPRFGAHVFGDLAVGRLGAGQGPKPGPGGLDEVGLSRGDHPQGADRRIPAEDARVAPPRRPLRRGRSQDAVVGGVAPQQVQGPAVALLQQASVGFYFGECVRAWKNPVQGLPRHSRKATAGSRFPALLMKSTAPFYSPALIPASPGCLKAFHPPGCFPAGGVYNRL